MRLIILLSMVVFLFVMVYSFETDAAEIAAEDKVVASGLSFCESQTHPLSRDQCYMNLSKKIDDPSICVKIQDQNLRRVCYRVMAARLDSLEVCDIQAISRDKDPCYHDVAVKRLNFSICDKIENQDTGFNCYNNIAARLNDSSVCDNTAYVSNRDYCFRAVSIIFRNSSICDRIDSEEIKDNCRYVISTPTTLKPTQQAGKQVAEPHNPPTPPYLSPSTLIASIALLVFLPIVYWYWINRRKRRKYFY